ncbi:hypothetical protein [Malaciobacter mytili]|nr:hypothetical protein [Malaciobacter mytili]AXH14754.1 hypothetical protein AMYT_1168 [Malaciobacter mytili LMG 24559]
MDILNLLIISLILLLLYISIRKTILNKSYKPEGVKKQEIIDSYEKEMLELLEKYNLNNDELLKKKKEFLIRVNHELSMNIFFEKQEAQEILQKLVNLKLK